MQDFGLPFEMCVHGSLGKGNRQGGVLIDSATDRKPLRWFPLPRGTNGSPQLVIPTYSRFEPFSLTYLYTVTFLKGEHLTACFTLIFCLAASSS